MEASGAKVAEPKREEQSLLSLPPCPLVLGSYRSSGEERQSPVQASGKEAASTEALEAEQERAR